MADAQKFGSLEWTVFMGVAVITLADHPAIAFHVRPTEREGPITRRLAEILGLRGAVTVQQVHAALPPFSSIEWLDHPTATGLGFGSVDLAGKADGFHFSLVKHFRFAKKDDPTAEAEVQTIFTELIKIRDTTLKAALNP